MAKPYSFLFLDSRKYIAYSNLQVKMWEKYAEDGTFNPLYKADEEDIDLETIDPSSQGSDNTTDNNDEKISNT